MDRSDWQWHGTAGHFICADMCCFRLHTVVGDYRISSVGCYHPSGGETAEPKPIGDGRLYETFVFDVEDEGPFNEIDSEGYNDLTDANAGHIRMCLKYQEAMNRKL